MNLSTLIVALLPQAAILVGAILGAVALTLNVSVGFGPINAGCGLLAIVALCGGCYGLGRQHA